MNDQVGREASGILASARKRYSRVRDVKIEGASWKVRDTGFGDATIVLLPGSLGTAEIFSYQIVDLSDRFRCLAIDYPDKPAAELARDFIALLDHLGLDRTSVLGASLAGYWIQHIAEWDRIDRIILASTFCDSNELRHHPLFDIDALHRQSGEDVKQAWMERLRAQSANDLRDMQLVLLRDGQDGELLRKRLLAAATASPAPPIPIEQERIGIVACDDDPLLFEGTRRALLERYGKASRLCLPTGGHYPHVAQFKYYNDFLDRLLSPIRAN
jgi:pimeloyl-ACP methyl ester carboxylesterase